MTIQTLLTSSADPTKTSLFIRGILTALVPLVIALTGLNEADVNAFIDAVVNAAFYITGALAAAQVVYGLARKLYLGQWSAAGE